MGAIAPYFNNRYKGNEKTEIVKHIICIYGITGNDFGFYISEYRQWGSYVRGGTSYENQTRPVRILSNVKDVVLNAERFAAVTKDGSLYSWGYQPVGDGTTKSRGTPVKILDNMK